MKIWRQLVKWHIISLPLPSQISEFITFVKSQKNQ